MGKNNWMRNILKKNKSKKRVPLCENELDTALKNKINIRMKKHKIMLILVVIFLLNYTSKAQNIAITTSAATPDASAMLDVVATNNGLLIPRIALTATNTASPITLPATSLVVYNSATAGTAPNNITPGFYFWDGSKWVRFQDGAGGNDWHIIGNSTTVATTNFLGTTDNVPLNFRVNNTKAGRIGIAADGSTFWGYQAGVADNLSDSRNTFIGFQSGAANTSGNNNTAMGFQAFNKNTTGNANTAIGHTALFSNINGANNTANGYRALFSNTAASNNTAIGSRALSYNTTGYSNVAYGRGALFNNTSGYLNCAFGTGSDTILGYDQVGALFSNTTGSRNIAFGVSALSRNTTGNQNIAIGSWALSNTTSSNNNIAIGTGAYSSAAEGKDNIAIGAYSLYMTYDPSTTKDTDNVVMGQHAMEYSSGSRNTVYGFSAMYANSSDAVCYNNCSFGLGTLHHVQTGANDNVVFGNSSLYSLQTGLGNTVIGHNSMAGLPDGNNNTALGVDNDGYANNSMSCNTTAGEQALYTNGSGSNMVSIGYISGYYSGIDSLGNPNGNGASTYLNGTPSSSVYLGNEAAPAGEGQANEIIIGSDSYTPNGSWMQSFAGGLGANTAVLGDANTTKTILRGKVGIGTTTPTAQLHIKGATGYNQLRLRSDYTPTSTGDTNGQIGDFAKSTTYIYVKTGAGWKRTAIATW